MLVLISVRTIRYSDGIPERFFERLDIFMEANTMNPDQTAPKEAV